MNEAQPQVRQVRMPTADPDVYVKNEPCHGTEACRAEMAAKSLEAADGEPRCAAREGACGRGYG